MNTFFELAFGALLLTVVVLVVWLIYSTFNYGLGDEAISEGSGVVIEKEIDVVHSMIMVGKVMVPTTTTYHYVTVNLNGSMVKMDVDEEQFNAVEESDTVLVGYTLGFFDRERHYDSVYKTEILVP